MPWSVSYNESVDCCFVHWTEALSFESLWGFMKDVVGESWFYPGVNVLHDFRGATAAPPQTDVRQLARNFQLVKPAFGDSGRVVILVPTQKEVRVAQTYVALAGGTGREFAVFTDLDEAKAWLGLPADYELPADQPTD